MSRRGWVWWVGLCFVLAASASHANLAGRASRAAQAGDIPGLKRVVRDTAEVLGRRELPAADLENALQALESAQSGLASWRDRREDQLSEDEDALDALYGSRQWLEIDHLSGEIDYWRGWVLYRLGYWAKRRGDGKTRQRAYFRQALRAFGRALPKVRDPAVGRETLLAVAALQRELGQPKKANLTLDRLSKVFSEAPPEFHERVRLERARTAADAGDLAGVLKHTEGVSADSSGGRDLLMLRLEALLAGKAPNEQRAAVRAAAQPLLSQGGPVAGQVVSHLANSKLSGESLLALRLGPVGDALAGLAISEKDPGSAATHLGRALRAGSDLPGLRRDVLWARLAEARFREARYDLAYAACESFRSNSPKSPLRGDVARLAYDAAKAWEAAAPGGAASRAVSNASRWVARDAPDSAEAGQVAVSRALSRAAASSNPDRAIRILDQVSQRAEGAEAVALQKVLLLSAKVQAALERSLQEPTNVKRPASQLAGALAKARSVPASLRKSYAQDLGVARARQMIGAGRSKAALEQLLNVRADFEATRTRLIALWRVGRKADAQDQARRLLDAGPGGRGSRWQLAALFAAVPPEDAPNPAVHARLLNALRKTRPESVDNELSADLTLRAAEASFRAGNEGAATERLEEVIAANPRALGTLHGTAQLYEDMGDANAATQIWHQASQLSPAGSEAWAVARVGVARSLRAAPGKAADGCAVAQSILASGRELAEGPREELRQIASSCTGG